VKQRFTAYDIEKTAPLEKIGIMATQDLEGRPHITFINSLQASGEKELTLGQFIRGNSKYHIQKHPKAAFYILSGIEKRTWAGKMLWTGKRDQGPELESYKALPLQRYNSYFPIHRVHYFDLKETTGPWRLPVLKIAAGALAAKLMRKKHSGASAGSPLTPYGKSLFTDFLSLKFFSFMGRNGFPELIPLVPCTLGDGDLLVFPLRALKGDLPELNTCIAVFSLKTSLESILVRGRFSGIKQIRGIKSGCIKIDWVYNSMPPNAGQIYPGEPLEPVRIFE